jgi:hypothetical protein
MSGCSELTSAGTAAGVLADGGDVLGRFAFSTVSAWSVCLSLGTFGDVLGAGTRRDVLVLGAGSC